MSGFLLTEHHSTLAQIIIMKIVPLTKTLNILLDLMKYIDTTMKSDTDLTDVHISTLTNATAELMKKIRNLSHIQRTLFGEIQISEVATFFGFSQNYTLSVIFFLREVKKLYSGINTTFKIIFESIEELERILRKFEKKLMPEARVDELKNKLLENKIGCSSEKCRFEWTSKVASPTEIEAKLDDIVSQIHCRVGAKTWVLDLLNFFRHLIFPTNLQI